MVALKHRQEFPAWYGKCFMEKRELLSRRLRADLDPVKFFFGIIMIYNNWHLQQFIDIARICQEQQHAIKIQSCHLERTDTTMKMTMVTPSEVSSKILELKKLAEDVNTDQFQVSIDNQIGK